MQFVRLSFGEGLHLLEMLVGIFGGKHRTKRKAVHLFGRGAQHPGTGHIAADYETLPVQQDDADGGVIEKPAEQGLASGEPRACLQFCCGILQKPCAPEYRPRVLAQSAGLPAYGPSVIEGEFAVAWAAESERPAEDGVAFFGGFAECGDAVEDRIDVASGDICRMQVEQAAAAVAGEEHLPVGVAGEAGTRQGVQL